METPAPEKETPILNEGTETKPLINLEFNLGNPIISGFEDGGIHEVKEVLFRKDIDSYFDEALRFSIENCEFELAKILLADSRTNPSNGNNLVIELACEFGNIELIKILLADPRVNPFENGCDAMNMALYYENYEAVTLLENWKPPSKLNTLKTEKELETKLVAVSEQEIKLEIKSTITENEQKLNNNSESGIKSTKT